MPAITNAIGTAITNEPTLSAVKKPIRRAAKNTPTKVNASNSKPVGALIAAAPLIRSLLLRPLQTPGPPRENHSPLLRPWDVETPCS